MNARPRLHLLLMSMLLWAAIPLLKVCCFGTLAQAPTCCHLTQNVSHGDSQPAPTPENHALPCCSGASYLAKEDTSIPAPPTQAQNDHLAPSLELAKPHLTSPFNPVHYAASAPSPQPLRRDLSVTLHTCCAPNAPPRSLT